MCNHFKPGDDPEEWEFALNMNLQRLGIIPADYLPGMEAFPKRKAPIIRKRAQITSVDYLRWGVAVQIQGKTNFVTNARNDKLLKFPWSGSVTKRRCLIPALGYFEPGTGPTGSRGEVFFSLKDRPRFFLAGLWDTDRGENGEDAFTMVTTEPNGLAARFHDRMPLALSDDDAKIWIGEEPLPEAELLRLCRPPPDEWFQHVEIAAKPREAKPKKITKADLTSGESELKLD